jgi:hypothetical protein
MPVTAGCYHFFSLLQTNGKEKTQKGVCLIFIADKLERLQFALADGSDDEVGFADDFKPVEVDQFVGDAEIIERFYTIQHFVQPCYLVLHLLLANPTIIFH